MKLESTHFDIDQSTKRVFSVEDSIVTIDDKEVIIRNNSSFEVQQRMKVEMPQPFDVNVLNVSDEKSKYTLVNIKDKEYSFER